VFTFKQRRAGAVQRQQRTNVVEEGVEVLFFDQLRERNIIPDGMSSLKQKQNVAC